MTDYKPRPMWQWFAMAAVMFGQAIGELRGDDSEWRWRIAGLFIAGGVIALLCAVFGWFERRAALKKPTIQL